MSDHESFKRKEVPTAAELQRHVVPKFSAKWEELGIALGLDQDHLAIISTNNAYNPNRAEDCCRKMLTKWLQINTSATWGLLQDAIKTITMPDEPVSSAGGVITKFFNAVKRVNVQKRLRIDKEDWPPTPPKKYTPVVLIQYHSETTKFGGLNHVDELDIIVNGNTAKTHSKFGSHEPLQKVPNASKTTKKVAEILFSLKANDDPQLVLIEGAPGIGKTFLSQEIACQWGEDQILQSFKLVLLLRLRDPAVQQMSVIDDIFKIFCERQAKATEITSMCSEYFFDNGGRDLALIFDGYDEYPANLQQNGLIYDILSRTVLPYCGLIVTSRPHASVNLREIAAE